MNTDLLEFVRERLEAGERIAPEALAGILSEARGVNSTLSGPQLFGSRFRAKVSVLLAASVAVACCGWFASRSLAARREADVSNVIALLRTADGIRADDGRSLAEALVAWQEAPCMEFGL